MMKRASDEASTRRLFEDGAGSIRARLRVFWPGGEASYWLGAAASVTVGRSSDCDVVVDHASVSRKHVLVRGGCPASVEDLDSVNGTRVRGARIASGADVPVFPGDVVEVGSAILVVQQPSGEAPRA